MEKQVRVTFPPLLSYTLFHTAVNKINILMPSREVRYFCPINFARNYPSRTKDEASKNYWIRYYDHHIDVKI
jgi:hypothetical protein